MALRGTAEILMGKNTMMRKCIRDFIEEAPPAVDMFGGDDGGDY